MWLPIPPPRPAGGSCWARSIAEPRSCWPPACSSARSISISASSLLPTAVADIGGESFYAWNMTIYLVAMVIATMLVSRFLARWGNAAPTSSGSPCSWWAHWSVR